MRQYSPVSALYPAMFIAVLIAFSFLFVSTQSAEATSQWSRKYKTPCTTCHTVFPRLNYYGEQFKRNGYQDPDTEEPDGNKLKKNINKNMVIDRVSNLLGFRLNVTPIKVQENKLEQGGETKNKTTIGDANWIQLFVAGSVFKNVSFFTEMQFEDEKFHFSWWSLGFHNIFKSKAINFTIGNVSPLDYGSHSNRLRIFAPIKNAVYNIKTANGTGDDSIGISGYRPAVQYFGYGGPVIWWAGVSPGSEAGDPNDKLFTWAGARLEVTGESESNFEGSSVTLWGFQGDDGRNIDATETTTALFRTSTSNRYQAAGNLRYRAMDIQAAYVWGDDEDGDLTTEAKDKFEFNGVAVQAGYFIGSKWYPAVSYDLVEIDAGSGAKVTAHSITPALSYLVMENFRAGLYVTIDLNDEEGYTKANTYQINLRTMF